MTVAPVLVAEQLPDVEPGEEGGGRLRPALREGATAPSSRSLFAATAWDALLIVQQASREALKKAKPGNAGVPRRAARRDRGPAATSSARRASTTMSASDHNGVDARSQVMVKIENGGWKLQP